MVDTQKTKKAPKKDGDLPLLEEVNELIEKERLLLQLKLVEQQRLAEEWKAKYDSLVGTATQGKATNKTLSKVGIENDPEAAAGDEQMHKKRTAPPPASSEGVQQLMMELEHDWVLDLSDVAVDSKLISQITTDVFSSRGSALHNVTVCAMPRSKITDESATVLASLAAKPGLLALDLSGNNIGPFTFQSLVSAIKARKRSPQYLLLNANPALMGVSSPPLLNALTDATWGLHLSAQDTAHGQLSAAHPPAVKVATVGGGKSTAAAAGGKAAVSVKDATAAITHTKDALQAGLYSNVVQPHKTLEALKALCDIISPPDVAGAKGSKAGGKKASAKSEPVGIIRTSKITTLAVLGFTHAHMCLESVNALSKLLEFCAPSLTDLDLSFAYTGLNGARALSEALSSSACQLVRLAVPGNNLADSGIAALSTGLRGNNTLTYLDARSNQISAQGLRSLCSALSGAKSLVSSSSASSRPDRSSKAGAGANNQLKNQSLVKSKSSKGAAGSSSGSKGSAPRGANMVLGTIDLSGNFLSQADVLLSEKGLREWGVDTRLKSAPHFPGHSSSGSSSSSSSGCGSNDLFKICMGVERPIGSYELYLQPHKIVSAMNAAVMQPGAMLYTVDMRYINTHYAHHRDHPVCLEWSMRPQADRTATAKDATSGTGGPTAPGETPWLAEPTRLRWELRLETPTSDVVITRGEVSAGACIFNQQGEGSTWARCKAFAFNLPAKGSLLLTVFACDGTHCPPAIESADLSVYSVPPQEFVAVGGDCAAWDGAFNSTVSLHASVKGCWSDWTSEHAQLLRGYEPLRAFHWSLPSVTDGGVKLSWLSRLVPAVGGGRSSHASSPMGYSWVVLLAAGGAYSAGSRIVSQGTCSGSGSSASSEHEGKLQEVLTAWSWRRMEALVAADAVCTGDLLVVAARPVDPMEGSVVGSSDDAAPCLVDMKNCMLWVSADVSGVDESGGAVEAGFGAAAAAAHDNSLSSNQNHNPNAHSSLKILPSVGPNGETLDMSVDCALGVFAQHNIALELNV